MGAGPRPGNAALALVGGGSYYADSGPRWALALLFVGVPLAVGLALGVVLRTRRA